MRIHSPETKAKISQSKKGKRCSPATEFRKGVPPWNKGKTFSEETKKKMRKAALGRRGYWTGKIRSDMSGENNPNWRKFGKEHPKWVDTKKNPFYRSIRQLSKYVEWRKLVFNRDNYTCRICGLSKIYVEADHYPNRFIDIIKNNNIKSFDDALQCSDLWDIQNGRTLCKPCHLKTLTWGNKKKS